ncbi:unnamed protein product [Polarella glacialis]|uniref:RING-type domain-containing protein n=1 Tax=Polarella glacialis TaxID=89957 RepID=A0A813GS05_POLGL|nr:unnamed protein product [Polarella glacialis]
MEGFIGIYIVCVLVVALVGCKAIHHFRHRRDETGVTKAPKTISEINLAELAELAFPEVCVLDERMCTICLNDIEPEEPARKLSCGHSYHASCISCWWKSSLQSSCGKLTCPTCRTELEVSISAALEKQQQRLHVPQEPPMDLFVRRLAD